MMSVNFNPRVMEVIQVWEPRGKGTNEDPVRRVAVYYTLDGVKLGEGPDLHSQVSFQTTAVTNAAPSVQSVT